MIPRAYITEWRDKMPWKLDSQVEHDLILSRLIVELFSDELLSEELLFRGGTGLYKLHFTEPVRFSEDIDLVQKEAAPIGEILAVIRNKCTPILGEPRWKQTKERVTLYYSVDSEIHPIIPLKFKIEINTREHFVVFGKEKKSFHVDSRWFKGGSNIITYSLDELLGTKMRALYQRSKGRDLFDLWYGIKKGNAEAENIVRAFKNYMENQRLTVTRREFSDNLKKKLLDPSFIKDTEILLNPQIAYSPKDAYEVVSDELIGLL